MTEDQPATDEPTPRVVYLPPRHEWGKIEEPPEREPPRPLDRRIRR